MPCLRGKQGESMSRIDSHPYDRSVTEDAEEIEIAEFAGGAVLDKHITGVFQSLSIPGLTGPSFHT